MKIECNWNRIEYDDEWWFDIGVCYQKTQYHYKYIRVLTLSFIIFSLYIRW